MVALPAATCSQSDSSCRSIVTAVHDAAHTHSEKFWTVSALCSDSIIG